MIAMMSDPNSMIFGGSRSDLFNSPCFFFMNRCGSIFASDIFCDAPRILGPSYRGDRTCIAGVRVLTIAIFLGGSGFLDFLRVIRFCSGVIFSYQEMREYQIKHFFPKKKPNMAIDNPPFEAVFDIVSLRFSS